MPSFTDITAYFATNRNRKSDGTYGNRFYEGDARLIRAGEAALSKNAAQGTWNLDEVTTYPERSRAASEDDRAEREWVTLGSSSAFGNMRASGISGETSDILIYLHGAGNSFESSSETLGQMIDLYSQDGAQLCPFFFTYPANGKSDPVNYFADRDDASISGPAMARAFGKLVDFLINKRLEERCSQRIHLLAHSLGNFALRKAVEAIFSNTAHRPVRLFDTVFLAHADDDEDTLNHPGKMRNLTRLTDKIVVYFDGTDKLLRLSDTVHLDRLGQKGPNPHPGALVNGCEIAAVDCELTAFDLAPDRQRHRHFLQSSAVVNDIRAVIHGNPTEGRTPVEGVEGVFRLS
ncbi:MAG: alpha/beta hydrolase [Pseudomonadota bacterium]